MTEMVTLGAYNLVTLGVYNLVSPVCRNNMLPKMIVRSLRMDSNYFFHEGRHMGLKGSFTLSVVHVIIFPSYTENIPI